MNARGWPRAVVAPVFVRAPRYPVDYVKVNVGSRVQTLVRATALLFERWEDQDQLRHAASTDVLNGLRNRRALRHELADERRSGSLLFIDVDNSLDVADRAMLRAKRTRVPAH